MSVQTMAKVFEQSKAKLGDRLVLLALANHSDPNDINSYPAVETLAREAGLCERQARRCLRRLEALGEVVRDGLGPKGTYRYRITLGGDKLSGGTNCPEDKSDTGGGTNRAEKVSKMSPEPSFNHPKSKPSSLGENPVTEKRPKFKSEACPFEAIVNLFHETLPTLPKVQKLTAARKSSIRQRYFQDLTTLEDWKAYFEDVKLSDFLMGRTTPQPGRKVFRATLEWLCKEGNFVKVSEGNYHS